MCGPLPHWLPGGSCGVSPDPEAGAVGRLPATLGRLRWCPPISSLSGCVTALGGAVLRCTDASPCTVSLPFGEMRCPAAVVLIPLPRLFVDHARPTSPPTPRPWSEPGVAAQGSHRRLVTGGCRKTMTPVAGRVVPRTLASPYSGKPRRGGGDGPSPVFAIRPQEDPRPLVQ